MRKDTLSVKQIRKLDGKALSLGFSERILIENASSNLCCVIDSLNLGKKALVAAGRGNNGADALACARKLFNRGYAVHVAVVSDKKLNEECHSQAKILERLGIEINFIRNSDDVFRLIELLENIDFVVDGILGIGIKKDVDGFLKDAIGAINESNKKTVSCDVPSGLNPATGRVMGDAVRADYTITFLSLKRGFFTGRGKYHCGKIYVVDIGVSREILEKLA